MNTKKGVGSDALNMHHLPVNNCIYSYSDTVYDVYNMKDIDEYNYDLSVTFLIFEV